MTGRPLDQLQGLQKDIQDAKGRWDARELAEACSAAAAVPSFGGRPDEIDALWRVYNEAQRGLTDAAETMGEVGKTNLAGSWAGAAHHAASDVLTALREDTTLAVAAFSELLRQLGPYQRALRVAIEQDAGAISGLTETAAEAAALDQGWIHDLLFFDDERMHAVHDRAVGFLDTRIDAHVAIRNAGEDFASFTHDWAAQARARKLSPAGVPGQGDPGLTFVDVIVLAEAGGDDIGDPQILSMAADERTARAMAAMSPTERSRLMTLLSGAVSPEQKAYLLKTLAAGYSLDDVARLNTMIAAHGNDPAWLDQHLSPLAADQAYLNGPDAGQHWNIFGNVAWEQGNHPTCVAASTITARAEVDPLYALQLTTGGHPGDPQYDNPSAFADRLRDEQQRLYDSGRHWYENWGHEGMIDSQSDRIADQEIASHTGARYDNVDMKDQDSRQSVLRDVERAVDDGYPVPVAVSEGDLRHQMMIIGHADGQVQIYNPWGYTYWVSEDDFVAGKLDGIDADIPNTPVSVRLPQEVK